MSGELPEELMDVDVEADFLDDEDDPLEIEEVQEEETERITVFDLGGELYGAPVLSVDEVIKTTPLTRVPRTADAVDGVIDIRGDITVIINPWVHLDLPRGPNDWDDQFVVSFITPEEEQPVGIRIDRIAGVEPIPVSDIDRDDPDDAPNAGNPLIEGVARRVRNDEVKERIGLVDIDALISVSARHPHLASDTDTAAADD